MFFGLRHLRTKNLGLLVSLIFLFFFAVPLVRAADDSNDLDQYKLRVDAFWFYSSPSGNFQGSGENDIIDIQKDLGFNSYSSGFVYVDWKFTRKNHFTFAVSPFQQSRTAVLNRTITFQGQTYQVGATVHADLKANMYAPGYQYDIIRRRRGHLGVAVQLDLFDSHASLSAQAQEVGGGQIMQQQASGSASLLAPIPVAGPQYRFYITDSPRLYVEGNVYGMYLFGYGNFVSTNNDLGVTLGKHFSLNAGYSLGSRLVVNNNSSTRIGLRLTQKGPLVGLEAWF